MKRLFAVLAMCWVALPALAQDYWFAVPNLTMEVFIRADSSARIAYDITFDNNGRLIDVVDIGVPHDGYRRASVSASMNGHDLPGIRRSEFVSPGYEVHLERQSIGRGESGTLHTEFEVPRMVYQDTTRDDFASFQITPTWFDARFISGRTRIDIVVHLPPGIAPDEVLWQDQAFSAKGIAGDDSHVVVGWRYENVRLTGPHRVGVSFPQRGMSGVIRISRWQLFEEWFVQNERVRNGVIIGCLAGFALLFFRFTGGTGISVFLVLALGLVWLFVTVPLSSLAAVLPLPPLIYYNERHLRRRRNRYLPAIAQIEGGGIKRGLTAQEAAVVLERPLGAVLGLVIFGLLKKGIVSQVSADPLTVAVNDPFRLPEDGKLTAAGVATSIRQAAKAKKKDYLHDAADEFYRAAAREHKTVIHGFEQPFLVQLQQHPDTPVSALDFGMAMRLLVERVAGRLGGFDLSDTRDYYRSVVERAATMARGIGDVEMREQTIDRDLEWLLMGDDLDDVFVYGRYRYRPVWTRGGGWAGSGGGRLGGATGGAADIGGKPTFGDVAASFAGWSENTMGDLASAIQPGSLSFGDLPSSGVVDLGGADRITGELLSDFLSSGGGGSGGGGGCACAGCACACACAGGGR